MKYLCVLVLVVLAGICMAKPTPGGHGGYGGGGGGGGQSNIYHSQQNDQYGYAGPYKFGYSVNDHYTGDYHGRDEVGDGHGGVSGSYHLREPDGRIREVKYVADYNGFRATVNGVPHGYGGYH
ncbi:hypothetical protein CHUAL_006952 [Chamberlinius hualienensis]